MTKLFAGIGLDRQPVGELTDNGFVMRNMGDAKRIVGYVDFEGNIFVGENPEKFKKIGEVRPNGIVYEKAPFGWWYEIGQVGEDGTVYEGASWDKRIAGQVETKGGGFGFSFWDAPKPVNRADQLRSGAALLVITAT